MHWVFLPLANLEQHCQFCPHSSISLGIKSLTRHISSQGSIGLWNYPSCNLNRVISLQGLGQGGGGPQGKARHWKRLSWFRNQHGSQRWAETPALLLKSTETPKGMTFKRKLKSTEHLQAYLQVSGNPQLLDLSPERSHHLSSRPSHGGQHIQVVLGVVEDSKGVQIVLPALPDRVRDNSTQVGWQNTGHLRWDLRKSAKSVILYWSSLHKPLSPEPPSSHSADVGQSQGKGTARHWPWLYLPRPLGCCTAPGMLYGFDFRNVLGLWRAGAFP